MTQVMERTETYVLGHSPEELRRLDAQGAILRPYTERLLREAGIGPGMRVLAAAQARAAARALPRVSFIEGDIAAIDEMDPFDAVVGRLILAHQPDPSAVLRRLAGQVRPGGVMAFGEILVLSPAPGWPERLLFQRAVRWLFDGLRRGGVHNEMGIRLHATFVDAGLPAPHVRLDGVAVSGADRDRLAWLVDTIRSLLPAIERFGVATAAEVGIDTLQDRLLEEATATGGAVCGAFFGGAWVRTPAT
ncbi:MAG: class I SAM-dependent methyltransferase [Thermomicrobiales bacterium]